MRIVDPETGLEKPAGSVGEIWMHGDNVALGYWHKPEQTTRVFGARINNPSEGTPAGPWLRTGDLGAMFDGELFIIGRIKDLLIVDGRNHYPDDIEATIREITGGRVAAISVEDDATEKLVAIVEVKPATRQLDSVKHEVTAAVWKSHNLRMGDLVLVSPGSIPITTSGKIRRSSCVELYREGEFQPTGHHGMTSLRRRRSRSSPLAGRLPGHQHRLQPRRDRSRRPVQRSRRRIARRGGAHR